MDRVKVKLELESELWSLYRFKHGLVKYRPAYVELTSETPEAILTWATGEYSENRTGLKRVIFAESCEVAKLFKWADPKLDKLISYDPFLVKRARRAGLSAELVFNGVDLEIFRTLNRGRRTYLATTYGFAEYELALEVHQAVRTVGGKQFIAGIKPGWKLYAEIDFGTADHAYFLPQTNTSRLVQVLNDSVYVVGLTQTRGIERIVTEGAACGAIPIVLDSPLYRFWFGESVLYVDSKRSVIDQLVQIFKEQLKPKQTFIWRKYGFNKVAAQIFSICWRWVKCPSLRSALA